MNAALWWALAFSFNAPGADCIPCHASIVDAFRQTGMGRSIQARPSVPKGSYYHRRSNRHYTISERSIRRHQTGLDGEPINVIERSIDFLIGSGNHAFTPVYRSPQGRLLQHPLSYYAESQAWAMSPGYDRPDHLDFRREIGDGCLFCHSASREPAPIDCFRCHGEAEAHRKAPRRGNIVNPARLPAARQLDICLQCHLETASSGFPDSILVPGRERFSYRPGEPLADYKVYFERADAASADRFEINHAGYRLLQSACFRGSNGRLTCTTCHDPHRARARADACAGCHPSAHASAAARAEGACATCHMPLRRTQDAIHVRMTDHKIARRPSFAEPVAEDHAPYTGEIVALFPLSNPKLLEVARNLHEAQMTRTSSAWRRLPPTASNLASLAEALLREGRRGEARSAARRSLALDPRHAHALNIAAVIEATDGKLDSALRQLEKARGSNPDYPLTWINLGVTYEALGRGEEALASYDEAIRLQPDSAEARRRRAALDAARSPRR
jgi:tetratricopeptide (TPR) repeat protein